ncbi:MAG: BglII/BstYI family type II restriction endonuclease [Chthoniobacter sp.]
MLALHHAEAILTHDMPGAVEELEEVLVDFKIPVEELVHGGGGEGQGTQRLRKALTGKGWLKHTFEVIKKVDGEVRESASHEVDHVKRFSGNTVALEIEWNNKDPFFDRDLENFKRLHADAAISVGAIITRGKSLHDGLKDLIEAFAIKNAVKDLDDLKKFYNVTPRQRVRIEQDTISKGSFEKGWARAFVADKFGEATTHWRKLDDRVKRGVGNPCPLLLIGIPKDVTTL